MRGPEQRFAVEYCRRNLQPDVSLGLLARLPQMIQRADVVHLQGVYCFTTLPTLALCSIMRKPVVWSASGALQRWPDTKHRLPKLLFEKLCDLFCARYRVVLQSASVEEKNESHERLKRVTHVVIPFGVSTLPNPPGRQPHNGPLRLLYLGRLNPIKGIENLIRAIPLTRTNALLTIC